MKNSIEKFIDIHTHNLHAPNDQETISISVLNIKDKHIDIKTPKNYFCLGIHPWHIKKLEAQQYSFLEFEDMLKMSQKDPSFFALGEFGLDKSCSTPLKDQIKWFRFQLTLAIKYNIQIIVIHSVKTYHECFQEIQAAGYRGKILLHAFKPNKDIFQKFSSSFETYISINPVFLEHESHLRILKSFDITKQLLETDDREDLCIRDVYDKFSQNLQLDPSEIKRIFYKNFKRLINS